MALEFGKKAETEADVRGGWFARLQRGLAKTRASLLTRLQAALSGKTQLDAETAEEIEEILYTADLGPRTVEAVLGKLRSGVGEGGDPLRRVRAILKDLIERPAAAPPAEPGDPPEGEPRVVLLIGVNGAGKTTTAGKLAARHSASGGKVLFAAADTFRAAAAEQIEIWAERAGCHLVRHQEGADPGAVVYDAIAAARARACDLILVDTAGRLHTKKNLMDELAKIRRVAAAQVPGAPHDVLLVLDAATGQNALAQVREFGPALGVTGLILTKLDGSAKGGVLVACAHESGLPVRYIGVGEGIEDLLPFDADAFVSALLGEDETE
ncbi:MAG: signal recognition particle-docking protein FtsY [bacterium]